MCNTGCQEECCDELDPEGNCAGCCRCGCCCNRSSSCCGSGCCWCVDPEDGKCHCRWPGCCRDLCAACCNLWRCFTYPNLITLVRSLFLVLHTLLVASSIFGLIWGNVYFDEFSSVQTGSILGGHLVSLSAGGLVFGLSGLYAAIKRHRRLLHTHAAVTGTVAVLRGFTWLLSMLHESNPDNPLIFGMAALECLLAALSVMLLRDACIYY